MFKKCLTLYNIRVAVKFLTILEIKKLKGIEFGGSRIRVIVNQICFRKHIKEILCEAFSHVDYGIKGISIFARANNPEPEYSILLESRARNFDGHRSTSRFYFARNNRIHVSRGIF